MANDKESELDLRGPKSLPIRKARTFGYQNNLKQEIDEIDTQCREWLTKTEFISDIFEENIDVQLARNELNHMAHHDNLTGLPNRMLFTDRLLQAIASAKRDDELLAVHFIDLDNFKDINDTLGHHCGDLLLKETAHRLRTCIRDVDTVARWGGG